VRDACSASSALADCPAEPRAGHPSTAGPSRDCPGRGARSSAPATRDLMQVNGPGACGACWHARAARATMAGWLVMTARPCCGGPLCPFWTGAGPRGRADGCPLSLVVTQAAAGAGHWAAGRRQRALAEWAGAAGFGLVAWGLGTEAPTGAEVLENLAALGGMDEQQRRDFLRKLEAGAPATAGAETPAARRVSRFFRWSGRASPVAWMVIGVPWRLRHPRRLTALAIANEAPNVAFSVLRAARAVQRRRPRIAAGSALVAAGSVARLRAASAEPLR
jgi:hypothetical protein